MLDARARIPANQVAALWQASEQAAGSDLIAVEAAQQLPVGDYRVFDYLLLSSANAGEGIRNIVESYPLLNEAFQFSLTIGPRISSLGLSGADGSMYLPRLYVLYIFATVLGRLQPMLGFRNARIPLCFGFRSRQRRLAPMVRCTHIFRPRAQ